MAADTLTFDDIKMGGRGGMSTGLLRFTPSGILWKRRQGSKSVEVKAEDIEGFSWMRVPRSILLGVRQKEGTSLTFLGFREMDLEGLKAFATTHFKAEIEEQQMASSGRNWGGVMLRGNNLVFLVDKKVGFEIPLGDVVSLQQQRDDVIMGLAMDSTANEVGEDFLTEVVLHVPATNEDFPSTSPENTSAKLLIDSMAPMTDTAAGAASEAVCAFEGVGVLAPRGRFDVEIHLSHLSLVGQSQDFTLRYSSIQRMFVLPKSNTPHTLVVLSLDPAIRKGNTYYAHVLCQFATDEEASVELNIADDLLRQKNEKNNGKLAKSIQGPVYDVFARILRGLSGARITRPGSFRNAAGDGSSVRCSFKADDGHLYSLDRGFFYVHKPPLLIPYDDVASVEFARQGGGGSMRTFDLVVRTAGAGAEFQFRNIHRGEWQGLLEFLVAKNIVIENVEAAQKGPGAAARAALTGGDDDEDDYDPGMRRAGMEAEDDEDEDEDFEVGGSGSGSGSESESDDGEGSDDDSGDAELIDEEGISASKIRKQRPSASDDEEGADDEDGGGGGDGDGPKKSKPPPAKKSKVANGGASSSGAGATVQTTLSGAKAPAAPKGPGVPAALKPVPADSAAAAGPKKKAPAAPKKAAAAKGEGEGGEAEGGGKGANAKEKKPRKKKDPNAPKKALSAFMFFSNDQRERIKTENPGLSFSDLGRAIGEAWKALGEEAKKKYVELAAQDKLRYQDAMKAYAAANGGVAAVAEAEEEEEADE